MDPSRSLATSSPAVVDHPEEVVEGQILEARLGTVVVGLAVPAGSHCTDCLVEERSTADVPVERSDHTCLVCRRHAVVAESGSKVGSRMNRWREFGRS